MLFCSQRFIIMNTRKLVFIIIIIVILRVITKSYLHIICQLSHKHTGALYCPFLHKVIYFFIINLDSLFLELIIKSSSHFIHPKIIRLHWSSSFQATLFHSFSRLYFMSFSLTVTTHHPLYHTSVRFFSLPFYCFW